MLLHQGGHPELIERFRIPLASIPAVHTQIERGVDGRGLVRKTLSHEKSP
jgi:hypothetical protein